MRLSERQLVVLRLLRAGPALGMRGLELVSASGGLLGRFRIYPTLSHMTNSGLIEMYFPPEAMRDRPRAPRPFYRITELGASSLDVRESGSPSDVRTARSTASGTSEPS